MRRLSERIHKKQGLLNVLTVQNEEAVTLTSGLFLTGPQSLDRDNLQSCFLRFEEHRIRFVDQKPPIPGDMARLTSVHSAEGSAHRLLMQLHK